MAKSLEAYKGCLLGMAVGDAMGSAVDEWTLEEIRKVFGPEGLSGYACLNGYATITAHTQLAAYTANGLLLGMTRGQMRGKMAPYVCYVHIGLYEWARSQTFRRDPDKPFFCWVGEDESMHARRARDNMLVDTLMTDWIGTMEEPKNKRESATVLTTAIPIGLFYDRSRISREEIMRLGAETAAMSHGNSTAFLSAAALSGIISRLAGDGAADLKEAVLETMQDLQSGFGTDYPQAVAEVVTKLRMAVALSESPKVRDLDAMEEMDCDSAVTVLEGAVYACLLHKDSFEQAMAAAVNHSGRSGIVAAVTGALFGCISGTKPMMEYFLKGLEPMPVLEMLAEDLIQGCPMTKNSVLFDFEWDEKYLSYRR